MKNNEINVNLFFQAKKNSQKIMHADKIIKLINNTVDAFKYQPREQDKPFQIPQKALIILPEYIGDVILLSTVIKNLRLNFNKDTVIDVVCNKKLNNLIETLPYIDKIHIKKDIKPNKTEFLKQNSYDCIFLFNYPFLWAVAAYKAGVNQRVSFTLDRIGLNYPPVWQDIITHFIPSTSIKEKYPQWKVYLNVIEELGLKVFSQEPEIIFTEKDNKKAHKIAKKLTGMKIIIHATSGSYGKNWDYKNWVIILKYLKDKYSPSIVASGTAQEGSLYDYLSEESGVKIYNLCGKTTIRETIALYKHIDMVITLDSAPAHFAAYAGVKGIVIIYGPTNEAQWTPYAPNSNIKQVYLDIDCRPCLTRLCHHRKCLTKLPPETVQRAIDRIIGNIAIL